jgi:trimethylamine--corrinoid protein Co-methyltransferase
MGHEKTLTAMIPALAGANLIYGPGMLESGITFDFAQLVMDNEFVRMIKHAIRGFEIDDENIAVEVIKEIGPGGHFLSHRHTLRHMRSQSQPELIDRRRMESWQAAGASDIYQRSVRKAREILDGHTPDPLGEDARNQIRSIIADTEAELNLLNPSNGGKE